MSNEELVRNACRVIWSEGDVSRVADFYGDTIVGHYPLTDWGDGIEGVKKLASTIRQGFPDYSERIDELVCVDDKVLVRLNITGTHKGMLFGLPATGNKVDFTDVTVCRVDNGKIVEQWGLSDHFTLYRQLGLISDNPVKLFFKAIVQRLINTFSFGK
ncbi:hypothetical protein R50073_41430 [Maricurvus nonylphenolicus]|uniref:ester cyclase n=1 Tax=Maricurvus nonylphenolicus TaxID=1008307 RepID=UPI0036F43F5C